MAADAAGNDILNVFIPVTGFLAFAPYGTAYPTAAELGTYGFTLPAGWTKAGLITTGGGFGWSEQRAKAIEFFQGDYQTNAGDGKVELSVQLAETSANMRQMIRNATADANGVINVDIDADAHWMIYTEEVDKLGRIRRRAAGNAWLDGNKTDRSTRGDVNANEAKFTVRRDSANGNKHFREALVATSVTSAPYIGTITPTGKSIGGQVLITGTGFAAQAITAFVFGTGHAVTVYTIVNDNQIVATIPTGATGSVGVVITNATGASNTVNYTVV